MEGDEEGRRTFLTALEASKDPETGAKLTMQELISNATLLLYRACCVRADGRAAGSQTTGNTITAIFVHLLNHRVVYDRVKTEIRERFSTVEEITTKSVRELPYLDAVLHEGMRLASMPFGPPRLVPPEGAEIAGVWVEGNVTPTNRKYCLTVDIRLNGSLCNPT